MAIKNPRGGKRGPNSSSSSYFSSTITTVALVAFCVVGIWFYTSSSSSVVPSHVVSGARSLPDRVTTRLSLRDDRETDPPPALDDTQGELPEDAIKDDQNLQEEKAGKAGQDSTDQEQEQEQQRKENDNNRSEDNEIHSEVQQQQGRVRSEELQNNDVGNGQQEEQKDEQSSEEQQQQNAGVSNEQPDELQRNEQNSEEQRQDTNGNGGGEQEQGNDQNSIEQQRENTDVTDEQKVETGSREEVETENVSNGQEFHPQIDEKVQRHIEEGEGGGITSQAQVEHDTEGTSEEQQQSQESSESVQQQSEDNPNGGDSLADGSHVEVSDEKGKTWTTQADQSVDEKERRKEEQPLSDGDGGERSGEIANGGEWEVCNVTAGPDYIPCLDNEKAIKELHSFNHFEHRERHCPEESPTCLVPLPEGYKKPIEWPQSRDKVM